jgi:hypothetical protein
MKRRFLVSIGALAVVGAVAWLAAVQARAQTPAQANTTTAGAYTAPRTADGQPDLQGTWSYATLTPLERPKELADKAVLSDTEAAAFEKETLARRDNDRRDDDPSRTRPIVNGGIATADVARAYNQFWWDYGTNVIGTKRTSLIIDPPDGRLPTRSAISLKRQQDLGEAGQRAAEGPEDRSLGERCIIFVPRSGPPMTPSAYNNNFELVQTKDEVAILNEQAHDVRIIPLDGRPHLPADIRQWRGDGRGRFEGNALVIETANYTDKTNFQGSGQHMVLVERFTRVAPDVLNYEFTVTDPESFARPWTVQIPMTRTKGLIYEYACHEGNYGMYGILSAARAVDKAAAEAAKKGSN